MIDISPHAIDRYNERHRPDWTRAACAAYLREHVEDAPELRERSAHGDRQRRLPCGAVIVVKHDKHLRREVVLTVLPARRAPEAEACGDEPEPPGVPVSHGDLAAPLPTFPPADVTTGHLNLYALETRYQRIKAALDEGAHIPAREQAEAVARRCGRQVEMLRQWIAARERRAARKAG